MLSLENLLLTRNYFLRRMGLESFVLLFGAFMPLITCSDYLKPPNDVDFIRVALDASALIHPLLRRSRVGSNGYGGA